MFALDSDECRVAYIKLNKTNRKWNLRLYNIHEQREESTVFHIDQNKSTIINMESGNILVLRYRTNIFETCSYIHSGCEILTPYCTMYLGDDGNELRIPKNILSSTQEKTLDAFHEITITPNADIGEELSQVYNFRIHSDMSITNLFTFCEIKYAKASIEKIKIFG